MLNILYTACTPGAPRQCGPCCVQTHTHARMHLCGDACVRPCHTLRPQTQPQGAAWLERACASACGLCTLVCKATGLAACVRARVCACKRMRVACEQRDQRTGSHGMVGPPHHTQKTGAQTQPSVPPVPCSSLPTRAGQQHRGSCCCAFNGLRIPRVQQTGAQKSRESSIQEAHTKCSHKVREVYRRSLPEPASTSPLNDVHTGRRWQPHPECPPTLWQCMSRAINCLPPEAKGCLPTLAKSARAKSASPLGPEAASPLGQRLPGQSGRAAGTAPERRPHQPHSLRCSHTQLWVCRKQSATHSQPGQAGRHPLCSLQQTAACEHTHTHTHAHAHAHTRTSTHARTRRRLGPERERAHLSAGACVYCARAACTMVAM